jgi:aspartate kinase
MSLKVCKFGGSSLADAEHFLKVRAIINSDPERKVVVVSAPGKRFSDDVKITDMLLLCHSMLEQGLDIAPVFQKIRTRYKEIVQDLNVDIHIDALLDETENDMRTIATKDFMASRGEYLCGKIIATWLGARFVEPAEFLQIESSGLIKEETYERLGEQLKGDGLVVMPGFYGCTPSGKVKTFSRGGSDISGAVAARAVRAELYENWTDVNGFMMADPRLVENPKHIETLTYKELRELAYMGANVLHDESIYPVSEPGIPIEIKNTNDPEGSFTRIVARRPKDDRIVTGIAGRKDFYLIQIEKILMNKMVGFGRRFLQIFESHGVNFEHAPTGIDTMSVIVRKEFIGEQLPSILEEIKRTLQPDRLEVTDNLALIATVGQGMIRCVGFAGRLCTALSKRGINLQVIDLGSTQDNMIVGVELNDFEEAVRAIYEEFEQ